MKDNIVAVMAKWPEPGKVKTRLAKDIGNKRAASIYTDLLNSTIEKCLPESNDNYSLGIACEPPDKIDNFKSIYPDLTFYNAQQGNDLGERMYNACNTLFNSSRTNSVILVGADIPSLGREEIRQALSLLELESDVVLGPTDDGGYYLIGTKLPRTVLFENIEWSSDAVFADTVNIVTEAKLKLGILPVLFDIDTLEDLNNHEIISLKTND